MILVVPSLWVYVRLQAAFHHTAYTDNGQGCRRSSVARCKRRRSLDRSSRDGAHKCLLVPQLSVRRATYRRHHSHQSPRTRTRRQLRCLGRAFQHIRLRSQRNPEEGRPVERHHRGILHWRLARSTGRLQVHAQRRHIVRHSVGRYRGCFDWFQSHDGRQHETRCSPATTHRCRPIRERRW